MQEATILSRLSAQSLAVSTLKAAAIRKEVLYAHLFNQGSQNSLRLRVNEILGHCNLVSTQTLMDSVEKVDQLLKVDPQDKRHLFYEQMKDFFYAMRDIKPDEIDEDALVQFNDAADKLSTVIYSIIKKRKHNQRLLQKFFT